jgi:hypothetical protein
VSRLAAWLATIATVAAMLGATVAVTLGGCGDNSTVPGPLDAPAGVPDLQFVAEAITGTVAVDVAEFAADDCAVVEGCVGASGRRNLLRFATVTANLGSGDLIAGMPPPPGESNDVFQWSPCHKHHHFLNYASFELIDGAGHVVPARTRASRAATPTSTAATWPASGSTSPAWRPAPTRCAWS